MLNLLYGCITFYLVVHRFQFVLLQMATMKVLKTKGTAFGCKQLKYRLIYLFCGLHIFT